MAWQIDVFTLSSIVLAYLLLEELYFYGRKWDNNLPSGPGYGCFHRRYSKRLEGAFKNLRALSLNDTPHSVEFGQTHSGQSYLSSLTKQDMMNDER